MDNKFIKFLRKNMIIIGPSTVIVLALVGFMIYGFNRPATTNVEELPDITITQQLQEQRFMELYELEPHNETNPFFVLDPFDVSPLTGLMIFETESDSQYEVVVRGLNPSADMTFVTGVSTVHYIPVYGLYAGMDNVVEIYEYIEGTQGVKTATVHIQTEELPEEVSLPTTNDTTPEYFGNDLMIMIPALKSFPVGFDYNGDVRWYLTANLSWSPEILENGRLLMGTDRLISDPYYVTGLYEIDYMGKVYREYKIPGGYHHDAVELPDGNLLVLTDDFNGTVEDKVVEIERNTGEIVKTWDIAAYLPEFDGMSEMWTTFDWFHNNSVDYDPVTDSILLSGRHQDAVISIGKTSRELNYIIGDPGNWSSAFVTNYFLTPIGEEFEWQYAQHSAMYLPNGDIFIFDNGNNKAKDSTEYVSASNSYSRGVIYRIDEAEQTIEQIYQFGKELGSEFYSPYISNVEYYDEGHYMVHSGGHGSVDGVVLNIPGPLYETPSDVDYKSMTYEIVDGVVMYYIEVPDNYYQAKRISLYTEQTTYITGKGLVLGELAETIPTDEVVNLKFSLLDTVPPRYDIVLTKESDRLKIDITLDREDVIYIVMVSDDERIMYHVPTSRTAYTAMCTATFSGDERLITYYINETNLDGDYDIYLIVNGREYHTYKHVEFTE